MLDESPVALAAWIVEKFRGWSTDHRLPLAAHLRLERVLDDVMVYWTSRTIASSVRWYRDVAHQRVSYTSILAPVPARLAIADAPGEIARVPEPWCGDRYPRLVRYTEMSRGGHFLAMENGEELARDVDAFVEQLLGR